ncbi:hypothetical protein AAFF_G00004550 [Aldrovandia affinis]|uniref:Transmembrane protein n=1 Tax=Aldrovandia affinis TaxID=143900 RepID=A0AAD7TFC9_9TELE|nr:hypothetical protein AAFF_G00004550 [Aldrovandia affinis]
MLHPIMFGIVTTNVSITIWYWVFILTEAFSKKIELSAQCSRPLLLPNTGTPTQLQAQTGLPPPTPVRRRDEHSPVEEVGQETSKDTEHRADLTLTESNGRFAPLTYGPISATSSASPAYSKNGNSLKKTHTLILRHRLGEGLKLGGGGGEVSTMETNLGPPVPREDSFFKNYKPPARDAITLPNYMIYFILASVVVFMALYAIIRHVIKDLIHDLADWLFGEQPPDMMVSLWENKDKFKVDWCPETSPELEELARREEVQVVMEGNKNVPAIWVISDATEPCSPCTGPKVAFGKISQTQIKHTHRRCHRHRL